MKEINWVELESAKDVDLRVLAEECIKKTYSLVVERVPDEGLFDEVRVSFVVNDPNLVADRYWLRVFNPPKGGKNWETKRGLSFGADKDGADTFVSVLLESGTKQDILEYLEKPELIDRLVAEIPNLSYHLEDL